VLQRKKIGNFKPKGRQVKIEAIKELNKIIGSSTDLKRDMLIEYLHLIQDANGYISSNLMEALSNEMKLPMVEVWEVASFYDHFDLVKDNEIPPPKKTIRVCNSLSCFLNGSSKLLKELKEDGFINSDVRIIEAPCLGACDMAPAAAQKHNLIPKANKNRIIKILNGSKVKDPLENTIGFDQYIKSGGYSSLVKIINGKITHSNILSEIKVSGLRGLGGAGFPTFKKWEIVSSEKGIKYVAVNGDEGEPGTFKDRFYLEKDPHRVLEGMLIAAYFIGAKDCYFYIRDEYPEIRIFINKEIKKVKLYLNLNINIHIRRGAGAYICGEESAMIESIEGKRGLPRHRPPYVAQKGIFNKPTLVNNIETLYWIREIIEKGGKNFARKGSKDHPGARSYSVSGRVKYPGVVFAPAGSTVNELIQKCGGIIDGHKFKAYLPGGASGGILPSSKGDVPLDFGGELTKYGCFVGSHAIVILSDKDNLADVALNLISFFKHESCGQCTPCRNGTEKIINIIKNNSKWDKDLLSDISEVMSNASICGLGQAASNPILSVLKFFPKDVGIK
tara:strand:- start:3506 stop:5185 length:1680 start_codon:yes stop_codon:yes gene_type:complete